jgi:hypothetical protein
MSYLSGFQSIRLEATRRGVADAVIEATDCASRSRQDEDGANSGFNRA